ncbi:MAG: N-acetylmuramoyl-L-alanine amidase AmpD [Idiomarinaceae bacterium HL-53]|nr:MAG: N-acetylmuramoyl-L-alanine amidase AmpD [Idiomarinaceae bacterium HL-53]CUS47374.1 AmpD protein [Idiomarinaceae bacterium HL-53]
MKIKQHCVQPVLCKISPHADDRPDADDISLLVIHGISLPAGEFNTPYIDDLFMGCLNCQSHPSFSPLEGLRVSAHCVIFRTGQLVQYVPFNRRAWHAGVSEFQGRERCNDFSIGIELEGTDTTPYTEAQYEALIAVTKELLRTYPKLSLERIVGHEHIAPGRKTDPGPAFDWSRFRAALYNA